MSRYKVTGKYSYNAVCESCGFYYKASELKYRWDGKWVCPEDWEYRHPSDFYRNRTDVHPLPFIRSDKGDVPLTWTPIITGVSVSVPSTQAAGLVSGTYSLLQNTNSVPTTNCACTLQITLNSVFFPQSTGGTSCVGGTITLPTIPGVAGTMRVMTNFSKILATISFPAGNATVVLPSWTLTQGSLLFSASYGT